MTFAVLRILGDSMTAGVRRIEVSAPKILKEHIERAMRKENMIGKWNGKVCMYHGEDLEMHAILNWTTTSGWTVDQMTHSSGYYTFLLKEEYDL